MRIGTGTVFVQLPKGWESYPKDVQLRLAFTHPNYTGIVALPVFQGPMTQVGGHIPSAWEDQKAIKVFQGDQREALLITMLTNPDQWTTYRQGIDRDTGRLNPVRLATLREFMDAEDFDDIP